MTFRVLVDENVYTWILVDDNKEILARCPYIGFSEKSGVLDQIKKIRRAVAADLDDKTPATLPKPAPYTPTMYDWNWEDRG